MGAQSSEAMSVILNPIFYVGYIGGSVLTWFYAKAALRRLFDPNERLLKSMDKQTWTKCAQKDYYRGIYMVAIWIIITSITFREMMNLARQ